jgi:O-antigen/teichoic acid export membrane protein
MSVSGIIQVIQQNYHQYAVAYHFDPATFAIYSVGCLQIPLVDFMSTPASNVMMVRMAEEIRDGRQNRILPIWHDTTRKLALMFFPLVGLLLVNSYPLITFLFGTAYAASVPIFKVWCLSILLAAFQTDSVLRVFAEIKYMFSINVARLALLLAFMGWFLGTFQLMGAVLITLSGMALAKVMAFARMRKVLGTTCAQLLPWKQLGATLMVAMAAALPSVVLITQFSIRNIVLLPLSGTLYALTYAALALTFGLLSEGEKAAIKRSLYVWNRWNVKPGRQAGLAGGSPVDVRCDGASGT